MGRKYTNPEPRYFPAKVVRKPFCDMECPYRWNNRCVANGQDLIYMSKCPQVREIIRR